MSPSIFFFTDPPTTSLYTLSLHDALPIYPRYVRQIECFLNGTPVILTDEYSIGSFTGNLNGLMRFSQFVQQPDRKSTRLNSSHVAISYAVFCLKKKKKKERQSECLTHLLE